MEKPTKREICIFLVFTAFVIFAWLCRVFDIPSEGSYNILRAVIYPVLILFWAYTLQHRLIHRQVLHLAVGLAVMLFIWFLLRTVKYSLNDQMADLARYLWYLYYFPMLFIPAQALLIALSVGMPETKRLPHRYHVIWLIAAAIFLLVITNDLHQLVFAFPDNGAVWSDKDYHYSVGYYAYIAWLVICIPATQIILAVKNRHPVRRWMGLLPCIPLFLLLLYLAIYAVTGVSGWIKLLFGDMTAVCCVLYMLTFELCIRCGLIRSNTGYGELFRAGRLGVQIADHHYRIGLSGENAGKFTRDQMIQAESHPVFVDQTTLIDSRPIHFGHVLWQKDVSELSDSILQIEENMKELAEQNRIHREKMKAEQTFLVLQEQNSLMDLLHQETSDQIELVERLLSSCDQEVDEDKRRLLLAGTAVVGSYIKRYGNLLLVCRQNDTADISDLTRCFEESFMNLELMNVDCLCSLPADIVLYTTDLLRVYRTFEAILESCLFDLHQVWVHGREREDQVQLSLELACDTDLSGHSADADVYSFESEVFRFTFFLRKEGGRK